jgi:hypothetical protein
MESVREHRHGAGENFGRRKRNLQENAENFTVRRSIICTLQKILLRR